MAESLRRMLRRELDELLAGERREWSLRAAARVAARRMRVGPGRMRVGPARARVFAAATFDVDDARRESTLLLVEVFERDAVERLRWRTDGLTLALALRMLELVPELRAHREQIDVLARRLTRWERYGEDAP